MTKLTNLVKGALLSASLIIGGTSAAQASTVAKTDLKTGLESPRQWKTPGKATFNKFRDAAQKRVVSGPATAMEPCQNFGFIYAPDGTEWYYTAEYKIKETYNPDLGYAVADGYEGANIKIFNDKNVEVGSISTTFELAPGETQINQVQLVPTITKKFFNVDDKYEVIMGIHATTVDYTGHTYNYVYTVAPNQTKPLMRIEGTQVMYADAATDAWSERYYMVFQRDSYDYDTNTYLMYFDVYGYATWGSTTEPRKIHTFEVDYSLFSGAGENAYPMLLQAVGGKLYAALPHYAKPFFDPDVPIWEEPVVTPDNQFVIDLYDVTAIDPANPGEVKPFHTTTIAMEAAPGYLYHFPSMGGFLGNDDLSYGQFDNSGNPYFIITHDKYTAASDDYIEDIFVYNYDGELVKTIATDVEGFKSMMPIAGQEQQFVFYNSENPVGYRFVDFPACEQVATIPFKHDGNMLSTSLDRVPLGSGYEYVVSYVGATGGADDTEVHNMAIFDAQGNFVKLESINLGAGVVMAQPAIVGEWLQPFLFNGDPAREYMFLVKIPAANPTQANELEERLWVISAKDNAKLLDFGPDDKMGALNFISIFNPSGSEPGLMVGYYHWAANASEKFHTLTLTSLPLEKLAGDGTPENPYLIAQPGDLQMLDKEPSAAYKVVNDLDFADQVWTGNSKPFSGILDGDGHVIKGLNLNGTSMFGSLVGAAEIKNLLINDIVFTPDNAHSQSGIIASTVTYDGKTSPLISNVHIYNAQVKGDFDGEFGGFVGHFITDSKLQGSSLNDAEINLPRATVGGIIGSATSTGGSIEACAVVGGNITGNIVGGIAGEGNTATITNCHVDASLTGNEVVGGIVGAQNEYMQSRGLISNCVYEGLLTSVNEQKPIIGGVVGSVESGNTVFVENCIVMPHSAVYPDNAATPYVHAIAGYTSGDKPGQVDWDNPWWEEMEAKGLDPYDYRDEWPRLPAEVEKGLKNNYIYLAVNGVQSRASHLIVGGDDATSVDGMGVQTMSHEFMAENGYKFGSDVANPWDNTLAGLFQLYFENNLYSVEVDREELALNVGDEADIVFYVLGKTPQDFAITTDADDVVAITTDNTNPRRVEVRLNVLKEGTAHISATSNGKVLAQCLVTAKAAGVEDVIADAAAGAQLTLVGRTLSGEGAIEVYTIAGVKVAAGTDTVDLSQLDNGIYIATNGRTTLKIVLR